MYTEEKRKIIILTYYRFPCTQPVLENVFARELGKKFEIIWLFQGDVSKGRKRKWHNSQVLLSKMVKGDHCSVKIINKILGGYMYFQLLRLLWSGSVKIVMFRDLPFQAFWALPLRLFFGFKLYYQSSAPLGDMNLGSYKINKRLTRFRSLIGGSFYNLFLGVVFRKADIVFPITEFYQKKILKYTSEDKLVPLTMGVDEEWLNRDKKEISHLKKMKKNNYLLTYFGTLSFVRNPQFILRVFAEVKSRCPDCKLILMGKTANRSEEKDLRLSCRNLGIEKDVIFTGQLARNNLQDHLRYCDISISAIPPENYYQISSPTKLYESLGNCVPVVGNREILEQEKVIRESGGGVLVDYNTISFSRAIVILLRDGNLREKMSRDGKDYVLKHYSYSIIAEKIAPYFEAGIN